MLVHRACFAFVLLPLITMTAISSENEEQLDLTTSKHHAGFFDFYWNEDNGKLWLSLDHIGEPFLYVSSLASGLGSNPVGLDRGQFGDSRVVRFRTVGNRVYLIQENLKYRALSNNAAERRAVADSFADSILWSGEINETKNARKVVELSSFLLRDAHDCIGTLTATGQGSYKLAEDLSFLSIDRTKAFPQNTEFEATLTFTTTKPGSLANRTAADGRSVTLRQHHSFVALPNADYQPRQHDPRVGCFHISFSDYGVAIEEDIEQKWITRHRLIKQDTEAPMSSPIKPIIYYVDPGAPAVIRDALIEGASWWNTAFEAAGFIDAFQVKVLPEEIDPMDARYNVIQWVHRATRGWSYGQSIIDPRTGEIIKGHVLLGSLRVRQDHLLFEGLRDHPISSDRNLACQITDYSGADVRAMVSLQGSLSSTEIALSRIRQLSAHEVGHTLGFAHNFAASTYGDRASVMDYPAPRVSIRDGKLDFSDAYGVGIGIWDTFTVKYAYSQFEQNQEPQQLASLVDQAIADEMLYISDADARPSGAAHPLANLWDNGTDPVVALADSLNVRAIAIANFSLDAIREGDALSEVEKAFVPVYLHHRYQVNAAAKMLGGYYYTYAIKGDGQTPVVPVPKDDQRRALDALLSALEPSLLAIPNRVLSLMPPQVSTSSSDRERMENNTSPVFDVATAIRSATDMVLSNILQPERAARLARYPDDDWNFESLLTKLSTELCEPNDQDPTVASVQRIVQSAYIQHLRKLATDGNASWDVRAVANGELSRLQQNYLARARQLQNGLEHVHCSLIASDIARFLARPHVNAVESHSVTTPPGSPIGASR